MLQQVNGSLSSVTAAKHGIDRKNSEAVSLLGALGVTAAKHGIDQKSAWMEQQQFGGTYPGAPACH